MRHSITRPCGGILLATLMAVSGTAFAQTATKPVDGGKTSTLGSGASTSSKLLTRDELRACMNQQKEMNTRVEALDAQKAPLETEKQAIVEEQAALKVERVKVDQSRPDIEALNVRNQELAAEIAAWTERVKAFNELRNSSASADQRKRNDLAKEQRELEAKRVALEADRSALASKSEAAVTVFNARAAALDAKVTDWNQRNQQHAERGTNLSDERQLWTVECANRRYREDDETAIRRGQ